MASVFFRTFLEDMIYHIQRLAYINIESFLLSPHTLKSFDGSNPWKPRNAPAPTTYHESMEKQNWSRELTRRDPINGGWWQLKRYQQSEFCFKMGRKTVG